MGGNENPLTEYLINFAMILPFLRKFQEEGFKFHEIGKLTYKLFETFYEFIPPKEDIFTEESLDKKKENAKKFRLKTYPHDWVFNFIEDDGKTFTFGINYSECEFYKFYKTQGAKDFMSIISISDYVKARPYRYGLKRTQTIRNGALRCDFRYLKNGNISRGWSIDNLLEYKNK